MELTRIGNILWYTEKAGILYTYKEAVEAANRIVSDKYTFRLPTLEELKSLKVCEWKWDIRKKRCKLTDSATMNELFLPATGIVECVNGEYVHSAVRWNKVSKIGYYWGKLYDSTFHDTAYYMKTSRKIGGIIISKCDLRHRLSVLLVAEPK